MGAAAVASSNRPDTAGPGPGPDRQIAPKTGHCSILLLSLFGLHVCPCPPSFGLTVVLLLYCVSPHFFWVRVNGLQCDLLVTGTCRRRQMYHLEEGKKISGKKREEKKHLGFCYDHVPDPSNASEIRKVSRAPGISKSNATYKSNQQVYLRQPVGVTCAAPAAAGSRSGTTPRPPHRAKAGGPERRAVWPAAPRAKRQLLRPSHAPNACAVRPAARTVCRPSARTPRVTPGVRTLASTHEPWSLAADYIYII